MQEAASRAAWFRGQLDQKQLLQRWQATVTTEIWRRAAKIIKACFPTPGRFATTLTDGEDSHVVNDVIDDDDDPP